MRNSISLLFLLIISVCAKAQVQDLYDPQVFVSGSDSLPYRILYPQGFEQTKEYPLVLFLHGAGERGSNNRRQLVHGATLFTSEKSQKNYPAIVIFPQCPQNDYWANVNRSFDDKGKKVFDFTFGNEATAAMSKLIQFTDSLIQLPYINSSQVYAMGLSMGGMGTFELMSRRPNVFAAAIPICGGDNPLAVQAYGDNIAFWIFHGAKDDIVDPQYSKIMYQALNGVNADVKLTIYPEANHNSWDPAFAEPELLSWLFSKKK